MLQFLRRWGVLVVLGLISILLIVLVIEIALISGSRNIDQNPTVTPTVTDATPLSTISIQTGDGDTPTPAPTPKPEKVACQADWTSSLNGWKGSSDWSVSDGQLVNDGTNSQDQNTPTLVSNCNLTRNFRIETKIQMQSQGTDAGFGLYVQYNEKNQDGYALGSTTNYGRCEAICAFSIAPASSFHSPIKNVDFLPGNEIRTYVVEVLDGTLTVRVDGELISQITENPPLQGGTVGFWNKQTKIAISSFKVTEL